MKAAFDGMASLNPVSAAAAMGMDPRDRARGEAELARMRARDGPRLDAVKASLLEVLAKRNAEGKATNGDPGKAMAEIYFDVLRESVGGLGVGRVGLVCIVGVAHVLHTLSFTVHNRDDEGPPQVSGYVLGRVADGMSGVRMPGTLVLILRTRRNVERNGALDWTFLILASGCY